MESLKRSGRSLGEIHAHPIVAAYTTSHAGVVKHLLSCSAIFWGQALLVQLALAITNPFVLLFALPTVNHVRSLRGCRTYDNLPDRKFLRIHAIVVVGLGFWLLAAQADVEHGEEGGEEYGRSLVAFIADEAAVAFGCCPLYFVGDAFVIGFGWCDGVERTEHYKE